LYRVPTKSEKNCGGKGMKKGFFNRKENGIICEILMFKIKPLLDCNGIIFISFQKIFKNRIIF